MRLGDLVQFKTTGIVFELGGHRSFESKRQWWVSTYHTIDPDKTYVVIEMNPKLYGQIDLVDDRFGTAILLDSSAKKYLITPKKMVRTVASVHASKR